MEERGVTNHFAVLGVSKQAGDYEVQTAYRFSAMRAHPDKGGTAEDFHRIAEAYKVLSHPGLRREYEAGLLLRYKVCLTCRGSGEHARTVCETCKGAGVRMTKEG